VLSDVEVWGYEQGIYLFKDLEQFLERGGPAASADDDDESEEEIVPRKRKGKERDQGDESDKRSKGSGSYRLYHCA
jgi:hypothetical protein